MKLVVGNLWQVGMLIPINPELRGWEWDPSVLYGEGLPAARRPRPEPRPFEPILFAGGPAKGDREQQAEPVPAIPPVTDIYSGKSLNDLLTRLQKLGPKAIQNADFVLEERDLRDINVIGGKGGGHVGLLKKEAKLTWPQVLRDPAFRAEREALERLTLEAVRGALFARVDPEILEEMDRALVALDKGLAASACNLPPQKYVAARRFLREFEAALQVLRRSDARDCFLRQYEPKGKTVAELVRYMTQHGLQFAPATAADEPAYLALHRALAACAAAAEPKVVARR